MVRRGLVGEVGGLISEGLGGESVRKAIGYRQTMDWIMDKGVEEGDKGRGRRFLEDFKQASRRYCKQQMQWWRGQGDCMWVVKDEEVEVREEGGRRTAEVTSCVMLMIFYAMN